jgi:hypothetical protein
LYINSKILLQVVLYDGFPQIVKYKSTLGLLVFSNYKIQTTLDPLWIKCL